MIGNAVGFEEEGNSDGIMDGNIFGDMDGTDTVGSCEGTADGDLVDFAVGSTVGANVADDSVD